MKVAPFKNFRKTWGKIEQDLEKGVYDVEIDYRWDVKAFEGEKWIVITDTNAFGGKNYFLGFSFLFLGCLSLVFGIALLWR